METRELDYNDGDVTLKGALFFQGDASQPRPGIVVFHDALGLGQDMLDNARALAELGLVVLAADLYGGRTLAQGFDHAMQLMNDLRGDTARWRIRAQAAIDALANQPEVDARSLGALGYCFGGSTALELVRHGTPLRGAVCLHGILQTAEPALPGTSPSSVLVCTGADDPLVPSEQIVAFLEEMRQADIDCQTVVYSGARHAFTMPAADNLNSPGMAYNPVAHRRSWTALASFFDEVLSTSKTPDSEH